MNTTRGMLLWSVVAVTVFALVGCGIRTQTVTEHTSAAGSANTPIPGQHAVQNATSQTSNNTQPLRTLNKTDGNTTQSDNSVSVKMPKMLAFNKPSSIKTRYGTIIFSALKVTPGNLKILLKRGGTQQLLYKFATTSKKEYKKIMGWQRIGPYVLVKIGTPSSPHPTTGDFGGKDVLINANTQQVIFAQPSGLRSTSCLASPSFFVRNFFEIKSGGRMKSYAYVVNLSTKEQILFQLPSNADTVSTVSQGDLYYKVKGKNGSHVVSYALPKQGWEPLGTNVNTVKL